MDKIKLNSLFPDMECPLMVAGPCSAESPEQLFRTAEELSQMGIRIFRAGIWKARSHPHTFEGAGEEALDWMREVRRRTGMRLATEVASCEHVEAALKAGIDLLWLGARTTVNPFLVQELADAMKGAEVAVLVKNPVSPDLELWAGAVERFQEVGINRIGVIHRGFTSSGSGMYRNAPQWHLAIEMRRRFPDLLMLCDPSHISGRREIVADLSQQAMNLSFDGLFVECHCCPEEAKSDAAQQLKPSALKEILDSLEWKPSRMDSPWLSAARLQIDALDDELFELLARRLELCRRIGEYKSEHNLPVLQPERYREMLASRVEKNGRFGIEAHCTEAMMEAIHEESVRQQMEIVLHNPQ